jgi:hypothetical protein
MPLRQSSMNIHVMLFFNLCVVKLKLFAHGSKSFNLYRDLCNQQHNWDTTVLWIQKSLYSTLCNHSLPHSEPPKLLICSQSIIFPFQERRIQKPRCHGTLLNYLGGGSKRIMSLRPAWEKLARPYVRNKIWTWRLGAWLKW